MAELSDAQLVTAVAGAIARPKRARADSFTLHAPMELTARAGLLPFVTPNLRSAVRLRIAAIAAAYAPGDEVEPPAPMLTDKVQAIEALLAALRDGDPDSADAAITFLIPRLSAAELARALADEIAGCLGAAAHLPILLAALSAANAQWGDLNALLRAPVCALAREGRSRLTWIDRTDVIAEGPADLFTALAHPEHVATPNPFIAPTMLAVEAGGNAWRTLAAATAKLTAQAAQVELLRIAALSMLQDNPDAAPYGWTHCLSLPQGLLALAPSSADPRRLVRAAASYVLGFRATLGRTRLEPCRETPVLKLTVTQMASGAGSHHDAHLAKYTLACLNAAATDVEARSLFLSAAEYLITWWTIHPQAQLES